MGTIFKTILHILKNLTIIIPIIEAIKEITDKHKH